MMKRRCLKCIAVLLCLPLLCLAMGGCDSVQTAIQNNTILSPDETYEKERTAEYAVVDSADLYADEDVQGVTVLYLAVAPGNEADGTDHSWTQINSVPIGEQGKQLYSCEGVLQLGNEEGPTQGSFGFGQLTANCVVRLQGVNASARQQKSYRINIKDGMGSVDGIKTLVLSKSFSDPLRITNMLCYRLMEGIPGLLSTRTRLVHLYVKDTGEGQDALYRDCGLYTMVEPINKTYFRNRNLDSDGAIYKAVNFDFARHSDVLQLVTAPTYDADAFETLLESKGDPDHSRLLNMLEAVNDPDTPIAQVIDTWFDAENLYNFLAFNLLTANRDADTQNFYLYSPTGSNRFYFIHWDNDGAFRDPYEEMREPGQFPSWDMGVFSYSDNVLFNRIFQDVDCISVLSTAVDVLYEQYLTQARISAELENLTALAKPQIYSLPDRTYARVTRQQYDELAGQISGQVTENFYRYYESLDKPAPFHIYEPRVLTRRGLQLSWQAARCSTPVTYTVQLDDSWDFNTPLYSTSGRWETRWVIDMLPPGQYFVKVTAETEDGQSQIAYETYATEVKTTLHGVLCFYVLQDGSVHASWFNGGD